MYVPCPSIDHSTVFIQDSKLLVLVKPTGLHISCFKFACADFVYRQAKFTVRKQFIHQNNTDKQEKIPVGCVPSAAVAIGGGVSAQGEGVCPGRVSAQEGGLPGGVSAQGVISPGVCIPACTEADTPVWTELLTHACENIALMQLRCGR